MQFIFNALNDLDELPSEIIFIPVTEGEKIPDERIVVKKTLEREAFSGKEGEVCAGLSGIILEKDCSSGGNQRTSAQCKGEAWCTLLGSHVGIPRHEIRNRRFGKPAR